MGLSDWMGARYEPETDSIKGCNRNTLVWQHEHRHKQQFNNDLLNKASNFLYLGFEGLSYGFFAIVMIFGQLTTYSQIELLKFSMQLIGITAVPFLLLQLALEVDAWIYTLRKYLSGDYTKLA